MMLRQEESGHGTRDGRWEMCLTSFSLRESHGVGEVLCVIYKRVAALDSRRYLCPCPPAFRESTCMRGASAVAMD